MIDHFLLNKDIYLQIFPMRHQSSLRPLLDQSNSHLNDGNSSADIHDSYSYNELSQNGLPDSLAGYLHQLFWQNGSCCDCAAVVSVGFYKYCDGYCD